MTGVVMTDCEFKVPVLVLLVNAFTDVTEGEHISGQVLFPRRGSLGLVVDTE